VDQFAGSGAFVALGRLEPEPAEFAQADPGQDARDRRERHVEQLGDLGAGEPQPTQRLDRFDPPLRRAVRDPPGRRRPV